MGSISDRKNVVKFFKKSISVAPKINFCPTNFSCGLCACWRGAAMPKLLADTLRMFALLGRIPSCVRRRARPGTGVYALARARHRVSARGHACICTRSHTDARLAKRGCSQQNKYALSEYEGRFRNRYRFLTPKTGPFFAAFFNLRGVVSLAHVPEIFCRTNSFLICT